MWNKTSISAAGTVVGGLIVAGVLAVIPKTSGLVVKVVSWVWNAVSWAWELLYSSHSVPGGVILVLSLLALFGLVIVGLLLMLLFQGEKKAAAPSFHNYTEDSFDGVRWRWEWRGNRVDNLWCFCPRCDASLVYHETYGATEFICERCPADRTVDPFESGGRLVTTVGGGDRHYALARAMREIDRRIRVGQR